MAAVTVEVDQVSKLLRVFVPMPKKDAVSGFAAIKEALSEVFGRRVAVGYLLDIDIWHSGKTRIMQDGVVVKGFSPKPLRYHVNPRSDLTDLDQGMPWRMVQDEFGKYRWIMKDKCVK